MEKGEQKAKGGERVEGIPHSKLVLAQTRRKEFVLSFVCPKCGSSKQRMDEIISDAKYCGYCGKEIATAYAEAMAAIEATLCASQSQAGKP